jgi:succinoglycan biosynthesis protein ExoL
MNPKVLYLVQDLNDPAVSRRIEMMRLGGIHDLSLCGFWRGARAPTEVAGVRAVALGQTFDGQMLQRALLVAKAIMNRRDLEPLLGRANLIVARNLEMLALAAVLQQHARLRPGIAYEVLDLHRLLLSEDAPSRALRSFEKRLLRRVSLLILSSPAFEREYFQPRQQTKSIETLVVENKCRPSDREAASAEGLRSASRPWRIGWFGMLRCRRTFDLLSDLGRRRPDLVQVVLRGRPALGELPHFDAQVHGHRGLTYGGPYTPSELAGMYRSIHFNWTIDYFEAGKNSEWLLPNRVYEGGAYDAVPIARSGTETARWIERHGIGVALRDPNKELEPFLEALTADRFIEMQSTCAAADRSLFVAGEDDIEALSGALRAAACHHGDAQDDHAALFSGTASPRL